MRIVALRPKLNTPDARGKIVNVVSTDMLIKDDAGYLSRGKSSEAATYRKVGIRALVIQMYLSMLDQGFWPPTDPEEIDMDAEVRYRGLWIIGTGATRSQ